MTGFRTGPPLERLAASDADLLDLARSAYAEAEAGSEPLNAFVTIDLSPRSPPEPGSRPAGALSGIPVAVKDNIVSVDFPTTCGSRLLSDYRSPYDATVVRRLRESGAVLVGKTNLDEFAMGSSTEHSSHGPTRNPLDRTRVPGGSSGGSAAAVAAGIVPVALGTETGGSIRQPASFCGVVGLTPTYGRVSRYGLVAFASSLDQVGVLGRTVADVAAVLSRIAGPDPLDPTAARLPPPAGAVDRRHGLRGRVVGVPDELFPRDLMPSVAAACASALRRIAALGAEVRRVSIPSIRFAVPAYHALTAAEASSNLARFDGARFGVRADADDVEEAFARTRARFGPEVKRRVMLGAYLLSEPGRPRLERARRARELVTAQHRALFAAGVDFLFGPTTATTAFPLGSRLSDPHAMHLSDGLTVPANLAGLPAVSIPLGDAAGLPVGGQLIGRPWGEETLLAAAAALEADVSERR